MRLSEAIMLGSATCKMIPGDIAACAFGCAFNAIGYDTDSDRRYMAVDVLWPWTGTAKISPMAAAYLPFTLGSHMYEIMYLFDNRVCCDTMTLERLVDYVRSIEPDCDCCRFGCDCKEKEGTSEVDSAISSPVNVG